MSNLPFCVTLRIALPEWSGLNTDWYSPEKFVVLTFGANDVTPVLSCIGYARDICEFLGIKNFTVNIGNAVSAVSEEIKKCADITPQSRQNLPPRIRMATLYAVSQSVGGRVANTCNLSEDWVGYSTRYGDSVGDFSPISHLTVTEVKQVGRYLGIPERFIEKPPTDGLCGKTDEDNLGFSYAELDKYIREGVEPPDETKRKIDRLHAQNLFKLQLMPAFDPGIDTI